MKVDELFSKCLDLTRTKGHDYTKDPSINRHENFLHSASISDWFINPVDRVYTTLIATKLTRLATLLNGKSPKNESIEDSFLDLINYAALWADYRTELVVNSQLKVDQEILRLSAIITDDSRLEHNSVCFFCHYSFKSDYKHKVGSSNKKHVAHVECIDSASLLDKLKFWDFVG